MEVWQVIWDVVYGHVSVDWFWNGKRNVVVDVVNGRIWISSDGGGVWNSCGLAWDDVNEVVGSVELGSVAWKLSRSVVVVVEWSGQEELEQRWKIGLVVEDCQRVMVELRQLAVRLGGLEPVARQVVGKVAAWENSLGRTVGVLW